MKQIQDGTMNKSNDIPNKETPNMYLRGFMSDIASYMKRVAHDCL